MVMQGAVVEGGENEVPHGRLFVTNRLGLRHRNVDRHR